MVQYRVSQCTGFIDTTISAKAVPATIGTLIFSDVIKVTYQYFLSPAIPVATEERWFARGVGLIYDNLNSPFISNPIIYNIGRS